VDFAHNLQDVLATHLLGRIERLRRTAGINYYLGFTIPVPKIDKYYAAHITTPVYPTGKRDLFPGML
jgi:hypothetical protein